MIFLNAICRRPLLALPYSSALADNNAMRSIPLRGFSVQAQPVGGARLNPQAVFDSF